MNPEVVIVTRHQGAVEWLRRQGITGQVTGQATPDDVTGKVIVGNLPLPTHSQRQMLMQTSVIAEIKERVKIEELIARTFQVIGRGRVLTTLEHDSLKIWPAQGRWWWFSRGEGGDVLDWQRLVARCDLRQAIEELAREAGIEMRQPTAAEVEERGTAARRQKVLALAAQWYAGQMEGPAGRAAREYCAGRGWTPETIRREGIGYHPDSRTDGPGPEESGTPDNNGLLDVEAGREQPPLAAVLREAGLLDEPAAKAVLSLPAGMIVYVHRLHGAPAYLSGRSINGKRHYNMPAELVGERVPYVNAPAEVEGRRAEHVRVLVEGQADAIALGQLGVPATALCGLGGAAVTEVTHVGLDNDAAGQAKALETALGIDPLVRVVVWPATIKAAPGHNHVRVKDAADLVRGQVAAADMAALLDGAESALMTLARRAGEAKGDERKQLLGQFFCGHAALEPVVATDMRPELAGALCAGSISQFNRLLKAYQREQEAKGEEEKASPQRYEATAGFAKAGWVFEQCVVAQPDGFTRVSFAVRSPDGKIDMRQFVEIGDIAYVPFSGDTKIIAKGVVNFPEKPMMYGSVKALVEEVRRFIHKYLDIDPFYERLAAYYVLFTWMYDAFENLPYLRAIGDYGTGKTRFIQAIGAVCYRPMFVSGAATVSPVFRLLDAFRGTLVIDEADFSNSEAENEIIKILNVGYYRGGVVLRSEKDPESEVYFPSVSEVYGPKILATRKIFGDRATESRCLTKHMTARRPRPGIPYTLDGDFWAEATQIRNKLLMYRLQNHRPIKLDQGLADESVEPRLNQVTLALKAVIDDPDMRQEIDQFIRAYNEVLINDRQMTTPAMVVQALAQIYWSRATNLMGEDERDFSMKGVAAAAKQIGDEIDPDIKWSAKRVGQILSEELGLTKRRQHPRRRRSEVVFEEAELLALMRRYGIAVPG